MPISPIQNPVITHRSVDSAPSESTAFDEVTHKGLVWRVRGDLVRGLVDDGGLEIEDRLRDGTATVVKSGEHRTVYRLQLPSGPYYLKHYRIPDWSSQFRNLLRRSPAEREWDAIAAVSDAGIATVERAALGLRKWGPFVADSFLLTPAIEPAETLEDYVGGRAESGDRILAARRQKLAVRLGLLIGALHSHGLVHGDLHAGNVLIRDEPGGELRLWLIDLHAVDRRRWISLSRLSQNLAMFAHFFSQHGTPADRLRFFQSYWNHVSGTPSRSVSLPGMRDPASRRHVIRSVQRACAEWSATAFEKADRKWHNGHRKLTIVDTPAAHCRGVAELGTKFVRMVAASPEILQSGLLTLAGDLQATFDQPRRNCTERDRAGIRIRTAPVDPLIRLRWLGKNRDWSAARIRWELGHALLRRGIPTPRPLLFAEERRGPDRQSYIVTESHRPWNDVSPNDRIQDERSAVQQAGRILQRLHQHGLIHTRLSEAAFITSQGSPKNPGMSRNTNSATAMRVLLSHVEAVRFTGKLDRQQVVEQLAQLNASVSAERFTPTSRLRFLRAYLGAGRREWKPVWRAVELEASQREPADNVARRGFLRAAMAVAGLCLGCQTPKQQVVSRPAGHSIRSGQLVVYSDRKLPKHHPLIDDLILLRKQITVALDLPPQKEEVAIYIFSTEKQFRDYLTAAYPGLPNRRAFFMGSRDELAVYTYWGERIQEDLRHEYTHGLLHASLRAVPLWLDEGLAEYFEVAGPRPGTVNTEYSGRLAASVVNGWRPNMAALEKLEEFSRMQHIHYQEAWAWVHYMLHDTTGAKPVLLAYLHDLRTKSRPTPLSERLKRELPNAEERFLAHASTLQTPQLLPRGNVVPAVGTAQMRPFPAR